MDLGPWVLYHLSDGLPSTLEGLVPLGPKGPKRSKGFPLKDCGNDDA